MPQRRRTFEQQRRWRLVRQELWKGRSTIVGAAVVMLGLAVVALVAPVGLPTMRGFVAASLVVSWFWMVFIVALLRTYPATVGEWAESFTRELIAGKGFRWALIDDVPLERGNVDHVAICPKAVLAIETKFLGAGRQWEADGYGATAIRQARVSARSIKMILRSQGLAHVPVQPVLMLWGPATPDMADGFVVTEGVQVVRGADADRGWRRECNVGEIGADVAALVEQCLVEFRAMRDKHERSKNR